MGPVLLEMLLFVLPTATMVWGSSKEEEGGWTGSYINRTNLLGLYIEHVVTVNNSSKP